MYEVVRGLENSENAIYFWKLKYNYIIHTPFFFSSSPHPQNVVFLKPILANGIHC